MPGLFADPEVQAAFAALVVFIPITIIVTGLRFYAAKLTKRSIRTEDWLALGALIAFLLWTLILAIMSLNVRTEPNGSGSTPGAVADTDKLLFAGSLMFPLNQLCAKLSILFLYYRIFGRIDSYAFWIKAVGALNVVHAIENVLVNVFQCVPVQKFWEPQIEGHCINYTIFLAVNESANSLIDFILAIQAVIMLRSLHTDRKTRRRLSVVFAIGGLAGIIGFVKIGMGVASGVAVGNQKIIGMWASIQMGLSIVCCCVITFRPVLAKFGVLTSNLTSKASLLLSWRNVNEPPRSESSTKGKELPWTRIEEDRSDCIPLSTYRTEVV